MTRDGLNDQGDGERQPLLQPQLAAAQSEHCAPSQSVEELGRIGISLGSVVKFVLALTGQDSCFRSDQRLSLLYAFMA